MIITVTKTHIKKGKPFSPHACPVALALMEQFNRIVCVGVGSRTIIVGQRKKVVYSLPEDARQFALSFDVGAKVKPFAFTLGEAVPA